MWLFSALTLGKDIKKFLLYKPSYTTMPPRRGQSESLLLLFADFDQYYERLSGVF
jgi:hypothetical protein